MILEYGFSVVGKSHISEGTCCQDSHFIQKLENGWTVAAVADGVGSAKNSHIGSKIAAETVVKFCCECMPCDYSLISIKSMMRTAYNYAFKSVLKESEKSGEPIESYDTTLTMVIYDGQRIIYGHSGDGAIIGLTTFGDYVEITRPQKGPDGFSVIPLRGGYTYWQIDSYEEDLAAVLLVTDGMLDTLFPYLLRDNDTKTPHAYTALTTFFADPVGLTESNFSETKEAIGKFITAEEGYPTDEFYQRLSEVLKNHLTEGVEDIIDEYKKNNFPVLLMQNQQDDKTVVGLLDPELMLDNREASFYSEPDWEALQDAWRRRAYPHLYAEKATDKEAVTPAPETFSEPETSPESEDQATSGKAPSDNVTENTADITAEIVESVNEEISNIINWINSKTSEITDPVADTKTGTETGTEADTKTGTETDTANSEAPSEVTPAVAKVTAPPKHGKPIKKGIIGFIDGLFERKK